MSLLPMILGTETFTQLENYSKRAVRINKEKKQQFKLLKLITESINIDIALVYLGCKKSYIELAISINVFAQKLIILCLCHLKLNKAVN